MESFKKYFDSKLDEDFDSRDVPDTYIDIFREPGVYKVLKREYFSIYHSPSVYPIIEVGDLIYFSPIKRKESVGSLYRNEILICNVLERWSGKMWYKIFPTTTWNQASINGNEEKEMRKNINYIKFFSKTKEDALEKLIRG